MSQSMKSNVKMAAKVAVQAARVLLNVSEDIPYFGKVATLMNKLIQVCDQCKCNKEASQVLQERFCRLAEHLFSGSQGLAAIAKSRPNNSSLAVFCGRMETILQVGIAELERFTKGGFIMSILKGSKPQATFESLDRDMTQCLNELSVALQVTALSEQAQIYDVVCNIQAKVDERGGLEGLMADPAQLASLAEEIGADVADLKAEVMLVLASLGTQVGVVDENVKEMKTKVDAVHRAVVMMQKTTTALDLTALQLSSHPVVDRSQVLGEGAFGKVYKGTYNHMEVAVKEVSITVAQDKEFLREVAMHHKVGNLPGVVRIFGANFTTMPRYIVLELAAGTMHDALHKGSPEINRTLPSKLSLLAQVCSTMAAISDMGILHRDLKSSNVLLFFNNDRVYAKISDFGLTKMTNDSTVGGGGDSPKGTLPYMAPELFRGQYSSASDMYAFAVLLNEVLTEQVPFPGCSYVEIVQSVGTFRQRPDRYRSNVTDALGCALMQCTERCWHQDPALRMSFHELAAELNHLLRKAVEAARVGNQASALTPPRTQAKAIETSIAKLADWLSSSCHLAKTDALPLAHTLVTVKYVSSVSSLAQILQRSPEFLTAEMRVAAAHEASILIALGINAKSSPTESVKLVSLSSAELCQLFDYCSLSEYSGFISQHKLKGMHLEDAIDSVQDLVDLGLDAFTSKVVFKRIAVWKEKGLPTDFSPHLSSTPSSPLPAPSDPSEPSISTLSASATDTTTASLETTRLTNQSPISDKQLDDDFTAASYCRNQAATDRIIAAAEAGNHLAEAYLSVLYDREGTCVEQNKDTASEYANKALPWLTQNAKNGNMYALYNYASCYQDGRSCVKDESEAVRYYKLAADQGHAGAQYNLGVCYHFGTGVTKDEKEAVRYYKLAADQGHAGAHHNLGYCYASSTGVTMDEREAVKYFKLAADQGDASAQNNVGECYANGIGVTKDEREAVKYYRLAADQGHADAQFNLGWCYANGTGVTKDEREAVRYYKLAADRGNTGAHHNLGSCYEYGTGVTKDEGEAVKHYKLAADQGYANAQFNLAVCYANGTGVTKDEREAVRYYKLAADQGNTGAHHNLGWCYANGTGVTKDEREAVKYYKLAADQGHAGAQCSLGFCYANGTGVTKDEREAVRYYKLAADQGNTGAHHNLGWCYANGTGVTKDEREAVRYYRLAADQGYADAQFNLGWCYEYGTGVTKDEREAVRYYKLAADQGHAGAQCSLGFCYANGTGVTKDEKEAVKYYKLAADQGKAYAQFALGVCYANGTGLNQDEKKAVRYYKLAANQGHAGAQYYVGGCYANGTGVTKDKKEAVKYYKLAADQGNENAKVALQSTVKKGFLSSFFKK